jgi:uncharacterized protein (DUF58 family)
MILRFWRSLFLTPLAYWIAIACIALFLIGFSVDVFFELGRVALLGLVVFIIIDILQLYRIKNPAEAVRQLPGKLSNGDENEITIEVTSRMPIPVTIGVVDEIPMQFDKRDFYLENKYAPGESKSFRYFIRPVVRGVYKFGAVNLYLRSKLGLVERKLSLKKTKAGPRFIRHFQKLKEMEFLAVSKNLEMLGVKKVRKLGHTMEFEQIRNYIPGDDYRTINWKATARKNALMVNQYIDERRQSVYSAIDMGRVMKMPFAEMTLLDYSINATLALSAIAIKKYDKPGLITFNKKVETFLKSDEKPGQMRKINEALYGQETGFYESNIPALYTHIRRNISNRSLILLFTNFESLSGMRRQLDYLRFMSTRHLLVVVFFENTELDKFIYSKTGNLQEIYDKTIAEKLAYEKRLIINELRKYGILSVYTRPEDLTVDVINKYIEIKSRRLL